MHPELRLVQGAPAYVLIPQVVPVAMSLARHALPAMQEVFLIVDQHPAVVHQVAVHPAGVLQVEVLPAD